MDELRSTIFSACLRRLLTEALQPGERVLWQDQPDGIARGFRRVRNPSAVRDILERARRRNA
jgi:hypothetical protein